MTDQPESRPPSEPPPAPAVAPAVPGPPAPAVSQSPYGGPSAYAAPTYAAAPTTAGMSAWGPLAAWPSRVGASLIDGLLSATGLIPYVVGGVLIFAGAPDSTATSAAGTTTTSGGNPGLIVVGALLVVVGLLVMLGIQLWNRTFKQGRTGQSLGKRVMGLKLVEERTGRPVGAGMAFIRELAHTVDGFFYIGYLWPLWDDKRQTFADKILDTVVIVVPKA